jgi:hypothetical protein
MELKFEGALALLFKGFLLSFGNLIKTFKSIRRGGEGMVKIKILTDCKGNLQGIIPRRIFYIW